jgi:hypothetical protein
MVECTLIAGMKLQDQIESGVADTTVHSGRCAMLPNHTLTLLLGSTQSFKLRLQIHYVDLSEAEPFKSLLDLDQISFPHFLEESIQVQFPAFRIHFVFGEDLQVNLPDGA